MSARKRLRARSVTLPLPAAILAAVIILAAVSLLPVLAVNAARTSLAAGGGNYHLDTMAKWIAADAVTIVQEHERTDPLINCLMEAGDYSRSSLSIMDHLEALEKDGYTEFAYPVYLPDLEGLALSDLYFGASAEEKRDWLRRQILAMPKENYREYRMTCILDSDEVSWYTIELDDLVEKLRVELEVYFATTSYGAQPQAVLLQDGREYVF